MGIYLTLRRFCGGNFKYSFEFCCQVAPAELEALLRTHPNVLEAGVVGVKHERYGEVPKAFVVLKNKDESKPEDIQNFMKGKISEFKELRGE